MKKSLFRILLLFACITMLSGCELGETAMEQRINNLEKPVRIISISEKGDVLVAGADGHLMLIPREFYLAQALVKMKVGDIVSPVRSEKNQGVKP